MCQQVSHQPIQVSVSEGHRNSVGVETLKSARLHQVEALTRLCLAALQVIHPKDKTTRQESWLPKLCLNHFDLLERRPEQLV